MFVRTLLEAVGALLDVPHGDSSAMEKSSLMLSLASKDCRKLSKSAMLWKRNPNAMDGSIAATGIFITLVATYDCFCFKKNNTKVNKRM